MLEAARPALVTAVADRAARLPAAVDDARARLDVVTVDQQPSSQRLPDPKMAMGRALEAAILADEARDLQEAADAVRVGMASGTICPEEGPGPAGFTSDYSLTKGSACAFVRTNPGGKTRGDIKAVYLPEPVNADWGETAAVLLAYIHARRTGFGDAAFYTDAASVVRRLRDLRLMRRYDPPHIVQTLLDHPLVRRAQGIDVRHVVRASTIAQLAVDQAARQLSQTGALPDWATVFTVEDVLAWSAQGAWPLSP
ncbi:hypothetical protein [Streptomyces triculaminicus]|uniref:hypothetical protein n=1 Tax=Streptomyces triculaminicus TaxID=2816232 RepID=UPI0037B497A3